MVATLILAAPCLTLVVVDALGPATQPAVASATPSSESAMAQIADCSIAPPIPLAIDAESRARRSLAEGFGPSPIRPVIAIDSEAPTRAAKKDPFRVSSILVSPRGPLAVIDGRTFAEAEKIDQHWHVARILTAESRVLIQHEDGRSITLQLNFRSENSNDRR